MVARAINTAPLITMSGQIIDGVGLDRATGLVHRIDPVLGSCIPAVAPTNQEIKSAIEYLLDDWLVDVALDPVGKCVAVLLALTLLQRALLPERPAFFVTGRLPRPGLICCVNANTLSASIQTTETFIIFHNVAAGSHVVFTG